MQEVSLWISNAWQAIVQFFSDMNLGMALWCGFAVLTLILFILMVTRWGQVKPLWKCAVLSIFAHVLFGCYAYGTKLIFTAPAPPPSDTFALKMIDSTELENDAVDNQTVQNKPWDEFDLPAESQPQVQPVSRPDGSIQDTVTRTRPEIDPDQFQPQVPTEVTGEIVRPVPPVALGRVEIRTAVMVKFLVQRRQRLKVFFSRRRRKRRKIASAARHVVRAVRRRRWNDLWRRNDFFNFGKPQ